MNKLSNTETELKKSVAYEKKHVSLKLAYKKTCFLINNYVVLRK